MDKTKLESLLERVEAATGPDIEVDRLVAGAFGTVRFKYTASIDAALALVERALPGWIWNIGGCHPDFLSAKDKPFGADMMGPVEWIADPEIGEEPVFDNHSASAVTAPLAILAALLRALIAQEATCAN